MTLRQPLVLNAGQIQQLQSGDTIPGGAAVVSMTTVEVTFTVPTSEGEFTVVDAAVSATSKIIVQQSGIAATGKTADENAMDVVDAVAIPASGSFTLRVAARDPGKPLLGAFKFNYLVGT